MAVIMLNETIYLKQYISDKEYKEIKQLGIICSTNDKINLKLELDYKISMSKNTEMDLNNINEYLYYQMVNRDLELHL